MELNKAVLDCMQTLRRRLRAETGEDIRLSHSDALPRMLQACHASRSTETRALGRQLAQLSGHSLPVEPPSRPSSPSSPPPASSTALPPSGTTVRIYRGQRVYA